MIQKVEDIKRPLIKGEKLFVLCAIKKIKKLYYNKYKEEITPIYNNPHSDKENGQKEVHYHADYRFIKCKRIITKDGFEFIYPTNNHRDHFYAPHSRVLIDKDTILEYIALPVIDSNAFYGITPVKMISKSKLTHKCIHKGKCPHRGFDLSQVIPDENGIITCPLHGLKFDKKTTLLIDSK